MKYLVTGSEGFIGRSLVKSLLEDDSTQAICGVDRVAQPSVIDDRYTYVATDLAALSDYSRFSDFAGGVLIHLAGFLGVSSVLESPLECFKTNVDLAQKVIEIADRSSFERTIFFSTSEVFGDGKHGDEHVLNDVRDKLCCPDLMSPRTSYPLSKICGEFLFNMSNTDALILRPHNIYGPNMGGRHVIPNLVARVKKANSGEELLVRNSHHIRSFCFIDDCVRQIRYLMASQTDGVFNVGNANDPITVGALAEKIIDVAGRSDLRVRGMSGDRDGSPAFRTPLISEELNSLVHVNLMQGIKNCLEVADPRKC